MFTQSTGNGQLIAALVVLVDAVLGVLAVMGIIHTKPDDSIITIAVVAAFNAAGYIWALIQHRQHVVALQVAGATQVAMIHAQPGQGGMPVSGVGNMPAKTVRR